MAELYADEDFDLRVVLELRKLGHDVLTAQEAGQGNQGIGDTDVLAFAIARGRVLPSFNRRDFIRLHRLTPRHRGLLICNRDGDPSALASRIDQEIRACPSLQDRLVRINRPQTP